MDLSLSPRIGSERRSGTDRIVLFSDAVFAIAITLLAVDLRIPSGLTTQGLDRALRDIVPDVYGFLLSFLVVGVTWMAHHRKFRSIVAWDQPLLFLNLLLLLAVAFVPFPSSLLGEYGTTVAGAALYSGTIFLVGCASALIWWHATTHRRLVDPGFSHATIRLEFARSLVAPVLSGVAFLVAFVAPVASQVLWWSTFLALPIVQRAIRKEAAPAE